MFDELQHRDIDIEHILRLFARVNESNLRRNKAIQTNLRASNVVDTKLSKMIDSKDKSTANASSVMNIFIPGSSFRFCFDIACMVLIVYFSIAVMFRLAFSQTEGKRKIVVFDIIADMFFIVDLYLRSSHFAFTKNGSICNETAEIRRQYMKSGLVLDAVSCLSVPDVLIPRLQLRVLRLFRVFRLSSFMDKVCAHLSLRGIRVSLATNLFAKIILFYAIANHWVACIWCDSTACFICLFCSHSFLTQLLGLFFTDILSKNS